MDSPLENLSDRSGAGRRWRVLQRSYRREEEKAAGQHGGGYRSYSYGESRGFIGYDIRSPGYGCHRH